MPDPILKIDSPKDLERILLLQKLLSRTAKHELDDIAQHAMLQDPQFKVRREKVLIENYSNGPTLTEFKIIPTLYEATRWGATFGVTVLVQNLIIERANMPSPEMAPLMRPLLLILINELNAPSHKSLLDPLKDALKFQIKLKGKELEGKERDNYIHGMLQPIVESFISAMHEYGLVRLVSVGTSQGWQITPLGQRVYLHLMDARKYLECVGDAHRQFQALKPQLSMV
jgi:hypothetical protein